MFRRVRSEILIERVELYHLDPSKVPEGHPDVEKNDNLVSVTTFSEIFEVF